MNRRLIGIAGILCLLVLGTHVQEVRAHEEITIGDYTVEVGWQNEPPVAWQENALVLHIVRTSDGQPLADASGLTVTISYGGQEKRLTLWSMEEPGAFSAPVIPTVAGKYTLFFGGTLGGVAVDAHMDPEEVGFGNGDRSAADESLQFPIVTQSSENAESNGSNWILYAGIAIGLLILLFIPFQILKPRR